MATDPTTVSHRRRLLRALGVVPYALRDHSPGPIVADISIDDAVVGGSLPSCVLVLPRTCSARESVLIDRAMRALGGDFARCTRVSVADDAQLPSSTPHVQLYVAFGEAQARALGQVLPGEVIAAAEVVLLESPRSLLGADAKRRLWQAAGNWRRHHQVASAAGQGTGG